MKFPKKKPGLLEQILAVLEAILDILQYLE